MTIRSTLLILTAALALLATASTAPAADGNAVDRWAQPAGSELAAEQAIGRLGRWGGRLTGSVQPHPRQWRPKAH